VYRQTNNPNNQWDACVPQDKPNLHPSAIHLIEGLRICL